MTTTALVSPRSLEAPLYRCCAVGTASTSTRTHPTATAAILGGSARCAFPRCESHALPPPAHSSRTRIASAQPQQQQQQQLRGRASPLPACSPSPSPSPVPFARSSVPVTRTPTSLSASACGAAGGVASPMSQPAVLAATCLYKAQLLCSGPQQLLQPLEQQQQQQQRQATRSSALQRSCNARDVGAAGRNSSRGIGVYSTGVTPGGRLSGQGVGRRSSTKPGFPAVAAAAASASSSSSSSGADGNEGGEAAAAPGRPEDRGREGVKEEGEDDTEVEASAGGPSSDDVRRSAEGQHSGVSPPASANPTASTADESQGSGSNSSSSSSSSDSTLDWRAFRARLVASEHADVRARPGDGGLGVSETVGDGAGLAQGLELGSEWAHAIYTPEKGCLLVASELLHGYSFFQRSVILMLGSGTAGGTFIGRAAAAAAARAAAAEGAGGEGSSATGASDDDDDDAVAASDGPYGIALNKPFPKTVSQVDSILPPVLGRTFGPCQVHVGGPIGPRTVLLLHRFPGLEGHAEVLPGVFVGGLAGLDSAAALVESGAARPEDFQVVLGYAGWGNEQLRQEVAQGWWYVAASSSEVVLGAQRLCGASAALPSPLMPGGGGGGGARGGEGAGGGGGAVDRGDAMWQAVLRLMGGEYAEVGDRGAREEP